mmetsp:Transcript_3681/g.8748  ORF Transcript_3681/g.8748 Transcript_3681/m.8748 type:complete len:288 (-) Transcript_3681:931-1794(-)
MRDMPTSLDETDPDGSVVAAYTIKAVVYAFLPTFKRHVFEDTLGLLAMIILVVAAIRANAAEAALKTRRVGNGNNLIFLAMDDTDRALEGGKMGGSNLERLCAGELNEGRMPVLDLDKLLIVVKALFWYLPFVVPCLTQNQLADLRPHQGHDEFLADGCPEEVADELGEGIHEHHRGDEDDELHSLGLLSGGIHREVTPGPVPHEMTRGDLQVVHHCEEELARILLGEDVPVCPDSNRPAREPGPRHVQGHEAGTHFLQRLPDLPPSVRAATETVEENSCLPFGFGL